MCLYSDPLMFGQKRANLAHITGNTSLRPSMLGHFLQEESNIGSRENGKAKAHSSSPQYRDLCMKLRMDMLSWARHAWLAVEGQTLAKIDWHANL